MVSWNLEKKEAASHCDLRDRGRSRSKIIAKSVLEAGPAHCHVRASAEEQEPEVVRGEAPVE